jgi:hypothetical protein
MVGFRAEVEGKLSGPAHLTVPPTPTLDIAELRDARWFHRDWLRDQLGKHTDPREDPRRLNIPVGEIALPGPHALARHLVEEWVGLALPGVLDYLRGPYWVSSIECVLTAK